MDISAARVELPGHDEDDILALIDDGLLLHAWNIATVANSEKKRREIRIFPACVDYYKRTQKKGFPLSAGQALTQLFGRPLDVIKPGEKPFVTSKRLSLLLNCGTTHIIGLIETKQLSVLPGTSWGTGPNGAALITLASIHQFFKTRALAWET
jgi:hypothetical protein